MTDLSNTFTPDWISAPGDTILDLLEERGWNQVEFASRTGYTTKHISQLINGKAAITEDTALKLERVLGSPASFWLTREAQYREALARAEERISLAVLDFARIQILTLERQQPSVGLLDSVGYPF